MNYTENNKLIAEFMEIPKQLHLYESPDTGMYVEPEDLDYQSSWSALMPVVEKIHDIYHPTDGYKWFNISINAGRVYSSAGMFTDTVICDISDSSISAVHQAVVETIQWYNQQLKS